MPPGSGNIVLGRNAKANTRVRFLKHTVERETATEAPLRSPGHPWDFEGTPPGTADDSPRYVHTPLCVDLDGTLLRGDMVWECIVSLFKAQPLALFLIPFWLLRGIARVKQELAKRANVDVTALPYRSEIISFLTAQREQGRVVVLVTAAEVSLAEKVAEHLGIFDRVYATQGGQNLKGKAKAALLRGRIWKVGLRIHRRFAGGSAGLEG